MARTRERYRRARPITQALVMRDHRSSERLFDVDEETDLEALARHIHTCCQGSALRKYELRAPRCAASRNRYVRPSARGSDAGGPALMQRCTGLFTWDSTSEGFRADTGRKSRPIGRATIVATNAGEPERFVLHTRCISRRSSCWFLAGLGDSGRRPELHRGPLHQTGWAAGRLRGAPRSRPRRKPSRGDPEHSDVLVALAPRTR